MSKTSDTPNSKHKINAVSLALGCFSDAAKDLGTYLYYEHSDLHSLAEDCIKRMIKDVNDGIAILKECGLWKGVCV